MISNVSIMAELKTFRLHIIPHTHVRTTKDERWLFAEGVTDEYLLSFGTKKYIEAKERNKDTKRTPNDYLRRKAQIKKYFDYKWELKDEAKKQQMEFPMKESWIKFYLPMPKSWSNKKRNKMLFELHGSRPDADNLFKAFADSLFREDGRIMDYRVSKFWAEIGFIEIHTNALPEAKGYVPYQKEDIIK